MYDPTGQSSNWEGYVDTSCVFKSCSNMNYTLTFGAGSSCSTFFNSTLGACDEVCPAPCTLTRN